MAIFHKIYYYNHSFILNFFYHILAINELDEKLKVLKELEVNYTIHFKNIYINLYIKFYIILYHHLFYYYPIEIREKITLKYSF